MTAMKEELLAVSFAINSLQTRWKKESCPEGILFTGEHPDWKIIFVVFDRGHFVMGTAVSSKKGLVMKLPDELALEAEKRATEALNGR